MRIVEKIAGEIGEEIIEFAIEHIFSKLPSWLQFLIIGSVLIVVAIIIFTFLNAYIQ